MALPTASPVHDWAGISGTRWAEQIDHFEPMMAAIAGGFLDHAGFRAGERVVEIGCGGGGLALAIAAAVAPGGDVLGLDISPALVALADGRAAGTENLAFRVGDAQTVMPDGAPFDRLASRFGVMFFADPAAAMRNLHAMLRPGGRLDIAVWAAPGNNPALSLVSPIARAHLDLAAPELTAPSPFALADPVYLRGLLDQAGFGTIGFALWRGEVRVGRPGGDAMAIAQLLMASGSLVDAIAAASDATRDALQAELARAIAGYVTPGGGVFPAAVHFVTARA